MHRVLLMARQLKKVLSLCNRRGFLVKRVSTKDAIREFDYGPLGTELKRNLLNEWWHATVTLSGNVHPVDSSIVTDLPAEQAKTVSPFYLSGVQENEDNYLIVNKFLRTSLCSATQLEGYVRAFGQQLPFGIAESGRVFLHHATEQSPLRQQECEYMCVNFVCQPQEDRKWYYHWQKVRLRWWKKLASNPENFFLEETPPSDLPQHILQESCIKFNFPGGPAVVEYIANRGSSGLRTQSNEGRMHFKFAKGANGRTYPHLISLSASLDGGLMAYMCDAYIETKRTYSTERTPRQSIVLKLHSSLSPCKVAVLPVSDENKLLTYCQMLTEELRLVGVVSKLSCVGSFSYRLALEDEVGTPYRIVVDQKTLETGIVSLQDRDTTAMEDMAGHDVLYSLQRMLTTARLSMHSSHSPPLHR